MWLNRSQNEVNFLTKHHRISPKFFTFRTASIESGSIDNSGCGISSSLDKYHLALLGAQFKTITPSPIIDSLQVSINLHITPFEDQQQKNYGLWSA
jgi:hypothetical protein